MRRLAAPGDFGRLHRGYFVLEAEAGLGKTAFLAHLARSRGYIHLFAEQSRGQEGVAHGLRSLAARLIRAWGLQPHEAEGVLPGPRRGPTSWTGCCARR